MRKLTLLVAATATLLAVALWPPRPMLVATGCGLTGYHWYHFCAGPGFIYPHHRVCRDGHCWD